MNELEEIGNKTFEEIKHIDENGVEYWYARELQVALEYKEWRKFEGVIEKAKKSCRNAGMSDVDRFVGADKTIKMPKRAEKIVTDYKLSRYACYLIAQNGDSRKKVIALAQTYFAIQTRKQELTEKEYTALTEDEKRFYQRDLTRKGNYSLNQTAKKSGVKNFDKFHNSGYKGLYNGETADDIAKRKGLRYREDILDNMGSEELAANLFRITQTDAKLKRDNVKTEVEACDTHNMVGKSVRETIAKIGRNYARRFTNTRKKFEGIRKRKDKMFEKIIIENNVITINMVESHKILKKYIKKLLKLRNKLLRNNDILEINLVNFEDKLIYNQFYELLKVILIGSKEDIYSKAYDLACDYLDSFFYGKNLCDFHNDKCGYKKDYDITVGCCRHFQKHKQFGLYFGEKLVRCEYLGKDRHCTVKCLGCKLMTCDYLNKKGIKFKQKDIFPIDSIFNWRQKIFIKSIVYKPKEAILKGIIFLS